MRKYLSSAILICSLLLLVYTACPTIYIGDDGELNAAAYTLGVGHPPGYPVFTMFSHLFTYLSCKKRLVKAGYGIKDTFPFPYRSLFLFLSDSQRKLESADELGEPV